MSGGEQGDVSGLLGLGEWWDNLSGPHSVLLQLLSWKLTWEVSVHLASLR